MNVLKYFLLLFSALFFSVAIAHGVGEKDAAFVAQSAGAQIMPFMYLGAKHMVTGYDHLLFIFGVIFFLYRLRDVALYVTMFSVGHSITLLSGVLSNVQVNPYLVDAVIGFSVAYKAFDNLGGFKTFFKVQPNTKIAVLIFGLVHGFGLATKLQELHLAKAGLVTNLVSFNIGVEFGQIIALSIILLVMLWWRKRASFTSQSVLANTALMTAGFVLIGYQLLGYFLGGAINGG